MLTFRIPDLPPEELNIEVTNSYGQTSLIFAGDYCHWEVMKVLVERGADVTATMVVAQFIPQLFVDRRI
jgi:hypothetical protein